MAIDPHHLDDDDLKRELDAAVGGLSTADLHRMAQPAPVVQKPDERGRIQGAITDIRGRDVFVNVGGKSEAFVSLDEFDSDAPPVVGQVRSFVSHGFDRDTGLVRLSLHEAKTIASWDSVRVGDVVEARVTGSNIGGLELDVHGIRGFMPKSQVDIVRHDTFAGFVNRKLECEITEIDRRGKTVLLSRRRVLERAREADREQIKGTLEVGQVRKGVVRRIADFGAFVDIGGVDGLLHVSDLSYARVANPRDVLKEGDEIEVQILKIDNAKDRISLGRKQLAPDPWNLAPANYRAGNVVDGRVTKLMDFGAFVELEPGIEGLIPVSELSWTRRVNHPRDVLSEGEAVRVSIQSVDPEHRRISLSLKALGQDPWIGIENRYTPDSVVSGAVMRIADFGAFIQLEDGVEGLAHISELSEKRIRSVSEAVQPGQVVQARVLKVDPQHRRISLSLRSPSAAPTESAAPAEHGAAAAPPPPAASKRKKPLRGGLSW